MKYRLSWLRVPLAIGLILIALAYLGQRSVAPQADASRIQVLFFDVGQGDATLISSTDGRHVLVDGGPRGSMVADYLKQESIDTLDLVVASHNHADHIGGLREVFGAAFVRNYTENGLPATTATYRRLLDVVARSGARVLDPSARTLRIGEMAVRVLQPLPTANTQNNRSIGLVIEFGEFRALFTGDAEFREIAYWLETGVIPSSTVVKVSHHGSWNGTTPQLVMATQPKVAVISVGASNQYGHPSPAVVGLWSGGSRLILRTDQYGAISVRGARDGSLRISTERGSPPLRDMFIPAARTTAAVFHD